MSITLLLPVKSVPSKSTLVIILKTKIDMTLRSLFCLGTLDLWMFLQRDGKIQWAVIKTQHDGRNASSLIIRRYSHTDSHTNLSTFSLRHYLVYLLSFFPCGLVPKRFYLSPCSQLVLRCVLDDRITSRRGSHIPVYIVFNLSLLSFLNHKSWFLQGECLWAVYPAGTTYKWQW